MQRLRLEGEIGRQEHGAEIHLSFINDNPNDKISTKIFTKMYEMHGSFLYYRTECSDSPQISVGKHDRRSELGKGYSSWKVRKRLGYKNVGFLRTFCVLFIGKNTPSRTLECVKENNLYAISVKIGDKKKLSPFYELPSSWVPEWSSEETPILVWFERALEWNRRWIGLGYIAKLQF